MTVVVAFAFIVGFILAYLIGFDDGSDAELELWTAATEPTDEQLNS